MYDKRQISLRCQGWEVLYDFQNSSDRVFDWRKELCKLIIADVAYREFTIAKAHKIVYDLCNDQVFIHSEYT